MNRLDPELLAEVHILFPVDATKPPQFFVTKPDAFTPDLVLRIMNGCLGALADFAVAHQLSLMLQCPACKAPVPMVQPKA